MVLAKRLSNQCTLGALIVVLPDECFLGVVNVERTIKV
jgi:hypothetical protein